MAKSASLLVLCLATAGCGGTASTPEPSIPARNGAAESRSAPSPAAAGSRRARSVTVGHALRRGACPACFGAAELPALSADGRLIAALQPEPFTALRSGAWPHTAWSFVVVDSDSGNVVETVPLVTREDVVHREYTPLNCCDDAPYDEEGCNPDACAPDPAIAARVNEQVDALVAERLANVNALLSARQWVPLRQVGAADIALEKQACDSSTTVRITLPGGDLTRSWPCSDNWDLQYAAEAYREDANKIVLVRVTISDDSGVEPASSRYYVHRESPSARAAPGQP